MLISKYVRINVNLFDSNIESVVVIFMCVRFLSTLYLYCKRNKYVLYVLQINVLSYSIPICCNFVY